MSNYFGNEDCQTLYEKYRAIPHKSARESGERFFIRKRCKTAGILCVFQGFTNAFLVEKISGTPPKPSVSGFGGVRRSPPRGFPSGTAERLSFCPPKGKTKDTKLATTQSADVFVRYCPRIIYMGRAETEYLIILLTSGKIKDTPNEGMDGNDIGVERRKHQSGDGML